MVRRGVASRGDVRHGQVRRGEFWRGRRGMTRQVGARLGLVRRGRLGVAWLGCTRLGSARQGEAGMPEGGPTDRPFPFRRRLALSPCVRARPEAPGGKGTPPAPPSVALTLSGKLRMRTFTEPLTRAEIRDEMLSLVARILQLRKEARMPGISQEVRQRKERQISDLCAQCSELDAMARQQRRQLI